jgi:hypothetical protein
VFLFFVCVNIQNIYDLFLLLIKDSLKILKKDIWVDLHWKFAQEIIKTFKKYDYKDIFILISKTLTSDVKVKKKERVVKKKRILTLYINNISLTNFWFFFNKAFSIKTFNFIDVTEKSIFCTYWCIVMPTDLRKSNNRMFFSNRPHRMVESRNQLSTVI